MQYDKKLKTDLIREFNKVGGYIFSILKAFGLHTLTSANKIQLKTVTAIEIITYLGINVTKDLVRYKRPIVILCINTNTLY